MTDLGYHRMRRTAFCACVVLGALACQSYKHPLEPGLAPPLFDSACHVCLEDQCPAQQGSCTTPACEAFESCAVACPGVDCVESCLQHGADPAASDLATCFGNSCSTCFTATPTPTPTTDAGGGACPAALGDTTCGTCLKQACCSRLSACLADSTCAATAQACAACNTAACLATCAQGSGDLNAIGLAACANASCGGCG
jgi:hypothetical protein